MHSDKPRQPSVEKGNHNQRQGRDSHGVITPGGLKHQNAQVLPAKDYNRMGMKASSPGARGLADDDEPARLSPRQPERTIYTNYDFPK